MGQKVNPHGLRVGVIKNWDSRWFVSDEKFGDTLVSDYNIRKYLKKELQAAGVPKIEIERDSQRVRVFIHCAKPGLVIGRGGEQIEKYKTGLCAVNKYSDSVTVTLDLDLRNACFLERVLQILSNLIVGYKGIAEDFVFRKPSRIPILDNAYA